MPLPRRAVLSLLLLAVALAGAPAVAGAANSSATIAPDPQPEPLTAGEQYCRGQHLSVSLPNGTATNVTYTLTRADDTEPVATVAFTERGRAVLNTSVLANGTYVLRDDANQTLVTNERGVVVGRENASNASVRVRRCSFDAQFEDREVELGIGERETLQVDGTLTDTVVIDAPEVPEDVLAAVFNGSAVADGVRIAVPDDGRVPMTFTRSFVCGPGSGDYEFTVRSARTGSVAQTSLAVITEADADASFGTVVHNESRNVVLIPMMLRYEQATCWDESDVVLRIGTNNSYFRVRTGVRDVDEDYQVAVFLNTSTAGTVPASQFMLAMGNDSLRNPTLRTEQRPRPIPEGTYELNLSANGDEIDVASFTIRRNDSDSLPPYSSPTATTPGTTERTTTATGTVTRSRSTPSQPAPTTDADGAGLGVVVALLAVALVVARRMHS